MTSSAAKSTDLRKQQKEIPSQQGNIPSSTSPKKGKKKATSFFRPVSLMFARVFVCFLFYLNYVCQSEGQVLNRSMAQRGRASILEVRMAHRCQLSFWDSHTSRRSLAQASYPGAILWDSAHETLGRNAKGQWNWSIAWDTTENEHSYFVLLCHLFICLHIAA